MSVALLAGTGLVTAPVASAVSPTDTVPPAGAAAPVVPEAAQVADDLSTPLEDKHRALRSEAVQQVLDGSLEPFLRNGSTVVKMAGDYLDGYQDQYVELERARSDRILVILTEFGDQRHPAYPDQDTDPGTPGPATFQGPRHNLIPEPDRTVDNSTVWQADYSADHFRSLYFGQGAGVESLKTYYETQSSGRYTVDGLVSDWVTVPYNEARYGRSGGFPCAGDVCSNTYALIRDGIEQWVLSQQAQGLSEADIAATLASYDAWDRYDFDDDGDFNEPDGYIDHFQIVHAGGDEADGDPQQGEDAIWSHRSNAYYGDLGATGPEGNLLGGVEIGDTGLWVSDYTIQPENGGLSVFAHEYGHDLGLPDEYDTGANGADNPNEYWTLMGQSRLGAAGDAGIGTRPGDLGAWQKLQLGWLDYETVQAGERRILDLGPAEYNSAKPQAAVVVLPEKTVTTRLPATAEGVRDYWSDAGDGIDNTLSRTVDLPAGAATLSFQASWNIEDCDPGDCDHAYVEIDDGSGFTPIPGSITRPDEQNAIDGVSDGWVPATFDLSVYAGRRVVLRFRYTTDGAVQGQDPAAAAGLFVDDVRVTAGSTTIVADTVETDDAAWTLDGFVRAGATATEDFEQYYIASNRSYVGYDSYLRTGPYNFGFTGTRPDQVEHYAYQTGLLISYWDTSQEDNNVSEHPGEGRNLYIDSHPAPILASDGTPLRTRVQLFDAPFGQRLTDSFTLHRDGVATTIPAGLPRPFFDDTKSYFDSALPNHGVKVANAGVKIQVLLQAGTSMLVRFSG